MLPEIMSKLSSAFQHVVENDSSTTKILVAALVAFIPLYWLVSRRKYNLPPGPVGLPIVGYLPFLGQESFMTFDKLSKKYGNVFGLYLGQKYVVILGDNASVKEALGKSTISGRTPKLCDFLPDGLGFTGTVEEEWVEQRRYTVRAIKGIALGESRWEMLVQEEVDDFVKRICSSQGRPVDISETLSSSVISNITSLVFGKRIPLGDPGRKLLNHSVEAVTLIFSSTELRNFFPGLCAVLTKLRLAGYDKSHKDMVDFNAYVRKEVEQRKKTTIKGDSDIFVDGYIREIQNNKENNLNNTFNEIHLCGNTQALIVGGSDTTKISLNWLFLAMASFPEIQDKVHQELDTVLGSDGQAHWSERSKLPYTSAVIMEGQRWKTVVPLSLPRMALEDTQIGGYDIPKGTTILPNLWGVHNDPKCWKNPEKFIPERFLTNEGKLIVKPESYVPFSYGKRNCPGETVALIEMLLYFACVMQNFRVLPEEGQQLNLEGTGGVTYPPVAQKLRFVPRG